MKNRALSKRALPYVIASVSGFAIAYLVMFFFVFPGDEAADDGPIPRVVGIAFTEAEEILDKAGFAALRGQTRFHPTTPAEVVLEQDPRAGSVQRRGAEVTLAVSGGLATAVVPNTRGASQQQARIAIESAGFIFGSVSDEPNADPRGAVLRSDPPAGTNLPLPATVSITISQGPASVQVPDFSGRALADARSTIEQLGLVLGGISRDTSSFHIENTVIGQAPAAGTTVSAGASVNLRVTQFPPVAPRDSIREEIP